MTTCVACWVLRGQHSPNDLSDTASLAVTATLNKYLLALTADYFRATSTHGRGVAPALGDTHSSGSGGNVHAAVAGVHAAAAGATSRAAIEERVRRYKAALHTVPAL